MLIYIMIVLFVTWMLKDQMRGIPKYFLRYENIYIKGVKFKIRKKMYFVFKDEIDSLFSMSALTNCDISLWRLEHVYPKIYTLRVNNSFLELRCLWGIKRKIGRVGIVKNFSEAKPYMRYYIHSEDKLHNEAKVLSNFHHRLDEWN